MKPWLPFFKRREREKGLDAEIESHLRMAINDRMARGESVEDARSGAIRELGNVALVRETTRAVWTWTSMEQLIADIRQGARILWKSPAFSATAVILLALVVGGNTTVYSFIHALISKPAPGVQADDLVSIGWSERPGDMFHAYADYVEYVDQSTTVDVFAGFRPERFTVGLTSGSYAVWGSAVTPNYFDVLGVRLALGRSFGETDDQGDLVAIISDRVWEEQFQRDPEILGDDVTLNGHAARIIGVAAPTFHGPYLGGYDDIWVPLIAYTRAQGRERDLYDRSSRTAELAVIGRLAPRSSPSEARAEIDAIAARLADPAGARGSVALRSYAMTNFSAANVAPAVLAVFSVVTAITLFVVCANVANLMLARAFTRQRETAVRHSLGASRSRILSLQAAEGLAIALAAWAGASLVAVWITKGVRLLIPPATQAAHGGRFNHANVDFSPDWQVLAYAMTLALLATVVFTIAPALRAWRQQPLPYLKAGEQSIVPGRSRLTGGLVVLQLALSVVLLTSAGLALRSWTAETSVELGFDSDSLLLVTVNTSLDITDRNQSLALLEDLRRRFQTVPGVDSASYARLPPPYTWAALPALSIESEEPVTARINYVGPDYLRTLSLAPVLGREFAPADGSSVRTGALITEDLAQALWPGYPALGQTLFLGPERRETQVVGVAPNALYTGPSRETEPFVFLSELQDLDAPTGAAGLIGSGETTFYVRYRGGSLETVGPAVARAVREADARVPIVYTRTLSAQLSGTTLTSRIVTMLLAVFSGMSLIIAAVGQYAVTAFEMRRRTREFGVRMAVGASSDQIAGLVLRQGLRLTMVGLLAGLSLSFISGSVIAASLYGVTPADAWTYLGAFVVLAAASLAACYLPARRAARIDPMSTLRTE